MDAKIIASDGVWLDDLLASRLADNTKQRLDFFSAKDTIHALEMAFLHMHTHTNRRCG